MPPVQLCVFDTRRGRAEGQEADKVLAYYPADVPADEQANVVGLVQAVSAFSAIFSQVAALMTQVCPPFSAAQQVGTCGVMPDASSLHRACGVQHKTKGGPVPSQKLTLHTACTEVLLTASLPLDES